MTTTRKALLIFALAGSLMALGEMTYQDAVAEQELYCEQARAGYWPMRDYCHE